MFESITNHFFIPAQMKEKQYTRLVGKVINFPNFSYLRHGNKKINLTTYS